MTSLNTTKGGTLWLVRLGRVPEEGGCQNMWPNVPVRQNIKTKIA